MADKQLSKQNYKILNVNPGCSWEELRRAYKKQIQKWHPDRFTGNATEQEAAVADDKIKNVNVAFNYFLKYYREHGDLPSVESEEPNNKHNTSVTKPATSKSKEKNKTTTGSYRPNNSDKEKKSTPLYLFLASIFLIIYLVAIHEDDKTQLQNEITHPQQESGTADNAKPEIKSTETPYEQLVGNGTDKESEEKENIKKEDLYFSYGSTIGEVINAQGEPTKIENETWYYGNAIVYFKDGAVIDWKRDPDTPLKIKFNIESMQTLDKKQKKSN